MNAQNLNGHSRVGSIILGLENIAGVNMIVKFLESGVLILKMMGLD
jgi:hypothetical protein